MMEIEVRLHKFVLPRIISVIILIALCAITTKEANANFMGSDDFSSISGNWGGDVTSGSGLFTVANGVLNFSTTSTLSDNDQALRFWGNNGDYNADWSIQMDVGISGLSMSAGDYASAGMYVQNSNDPSQDFVRVILRKDNASSESFYADAFVNGASFGSVFIPTISSSVTLALSYDSTLHTLLAAYDGDGATNGYSFTSFLDISIAEGASNWGMTEDDAFQARIFAQTAQIPVSIGQITIDNFATSTTSISLVPIPAAFWLFGSGLLGLIEIARRKKAA